MLRSALLAILALLVASPAAALNLFDDGENSLDLSLFVRAGLFGVVPEVEAASVEPRVYQARVYATAAREGIGEAYVQLEGNDGSVDLIDTWAMLTPLPQLELIAGRYRAPFGLEQVLSRRLIPFPSRALATSYVARRMEGAHVGLVSQDVLPGSRLDIGLSNERRSVSGETREGLFLTARGKLRPVETVELHAALAESVAGRNAGRALGDLYDTQRLLSAGVTLDFDAFFFLAEMVTVMQTPTTAGDEAGAGDETLLAFATYGRVPVALRNGQALVPLFGFGGREELDNLDDRSLRLRIRSGLEWQLVGNKISTAWTFDHERSNGQGDQNVNILNWHMQFIL